MSVLGRRLWVGIRRTLGDPVEDMLWLTKPTQVALTPRGCLPGLSF